MDAYLRRPSIMADVIHTVLLNRDVRRKLFRELNLDSVESKQPFTDDELLQPKITFLPITEESDRQLALSALIATTVTLILHLCLQEQYDSKDKLKIQRKYLQSIHLRCKEIRNDIDVLYKKFIEYDPGFFEVINTLLPDKKEKNKYMRYILCHPELKQIPLSKQEGFVDMLNSLPLDCVDNAKGIFDNYAPDLIIRLRNLQREISEFSGIIRHAERNLPRYGGGRPGKSILNFTIKCLVDVFNVHNRCSRSMYDYALEKEYSESEKKKYTMGNRVRFVAAAFDASGIPRSGRPNYTSLEQIPDSGSDDFVNKIHKANRNPVDLQTLVMKAMKNDPFPEELGFGFDFDAVDPQDIIFSFLVHVRLFGVHSV